MKIRLADLWDGPLDLHGKLAPEPYDLSVSGGEQWSPLTYRLRAEILGETELLVRGSVSAALTVPCARCLEPITLTVTVPDFTASVPFTTEEAIDLTPLLREDILLNLPMAPSHSDVGGQCPPQVERLYHADADRYAAQRRSEAWGALDKLNEERT
ncbi:MAG: DUF177 domain-containing protein [Verrucomicrobiales bacterium]|jgi:uncharacterized metal-binding protein YceD (DUF177 family)|nr:DUF177 domain-containing protein [Verrucomicrobiales bacterium]